MRVPITVIMVLTPAMSSAQFSHIPVLNHGREVLQSYTNKSQASYDPTYRAAYTYYIAFQSQHPRYSASDWCWSLHYISSSSSSSNCSRGWTWPHRVTTPVLANLLVRQLSGVLFSVAVGDKVGLHIGLGRLHRHHHVCQQADNI